MLALLDVIAQPDNITEGDFWRHQPFVKLPKEVWPEKPDSFKKLASHSSLRGLRFAVPSMYIGGMVPRGAEPVWTSGAVIELWKQAKRDLEALGAQVVITDDFPVVTGYENAQQLPKDCPRLPASWANTERGRLIAHAWNEFLRNNGDSAIPDIAAVDTAEIYPDRLRTAPELKYLAPANKIHFSRLTEYVQARTLFETKDMAEALQTLETMRKRLFDDYLTTHNCDCAVFPAAGDVGPADADSNHESAEHAWRNGVKYSNGNRAIRHLGIPTVSVPMGVMSDKKMPVNLTFAGRAYEDVRLLNWANAFENTTRRRIAPDYTPALPGEAKGRGDAVVRSEVARPRLVIRSCKLTPRSNGCSRLAIQGEIQGRGDGSGLRDCIEIRVNGHKVRHQDIHFSSTGMDGTKTFHVDAMLEAQDVKPSDNKTEAPVARDKSLVVILARCERNGRPSGWLGFV